MTHLDFLYHIYSAGAVIQRGCDWYKTLRNLFRLHSMKYILAPTTCKVYSYCTDSPARNVISMFAADAWIDLTGCAMVPAHLLVSQFDTSTYHTEVQYHILIPRTVRTNYKIITILGGFSVHPSELLSTLLYTQFTTQDNHVTLPHPPSYCPGLPSRNPSPICSLNYGLPPPSCAGVVNLHQLPLPTSHVPVSLTSYVIYPSSFPPSPRHHRNRTTFNLPVRLCLCLRLCLRLPNSGWSSRARSSLRHLIRPSKCHHRRHTFL